MKKIVVLLLTVLFAATPVWADSFVNGGFETGDLTGWTQGGGSWYGGGFPVSPAVYTGGIPNNTIMNVGLDPITNASTVYNGTHSVRVNDSYNNWSVSTVVQSVNNYTDPNIYFAWNAVLESSHDWYDSDYFGLVLRDVTDGVDLVTRTYSSATSPGIFTQFGNWFSSGWMVENINVAGLGLTGHTFSLSLLASDCPYGGHAGYVYLDGFGAAPPVQTVPEPATLMLFGAGLVGLGFGRKRFKKN